MKISIDLDGCAWSHMALFRELCWGENIELRFGILCDHEPESKEADIALWKARGFPEPDFFLCEPGAENKAKAILREKIDYHFDDCDQGDPVSIGTFQRILGPEFFRLVRIEPRQPLDVHYE